MDDKLQKTLRFIAGDEAAEAPQGRREVSATETPDVELLAA